MGLINCLHSVVVSSLEYPYVVCVIASRTLKRGGSKVGVTEIGALKNVTCGLLLYSLFYGVINVSTDLLVETFSVFVLIQFSKANYSLI